MYKCIFGGIIGGKIPVKYRPCIAFGRPCAVVLHSDLLSTFPIASSSCGPVHEVTLSIHAVFGLSLFLFPGEVPRIVFLMKYCCYLLAGGKCMKRVNRAVTADDWAPGITLSFHALSFTYTLTQSPRTRTVYTVKPKSNILLISVA